MRLFSKKALAVSLASLIAVPTSAFATNGYFLIGYGAKARGMGGVGVALGQDSLAAAHNPATMTDVKMGTMRLDAGGELFSPQRSMSHSSDTLGNTREKSGSNLFLIPSMGGIYKFNRKITMGMAAIGNGANTRYDQTVPGNPTCVNGDTSGGTESYFFNFNCNADSQTVGVNLLQMQMLPSIAYKVNKNHSVGVSLAIGVQSFRAYGLGAFEDLGFAGEGATKTSGNGNDFSYGAGVRFGWLGKFFDKRLSVGANYSSRVYMTKFDKYEELFAEQGSFDIPENFALGFAFKATPKLTLALDLQRIKYSDIASINNPGPNAYDNTDLNPLCPGADLPRCKLGGDDGMGFGWQDTDIIKVGANYDFNKAWSFRIGYNHGDGVVKDDQILFNFLAPAVVKEHVTLGGSYRPNKNIEWSFNYVHAFEETVNGPTAFSNLAPGEDNGSASMYIDTLGVSFAYIM
ncbi:MAG: outer membrane protein transport protein [Deltaproteobacteria bacterium]|nr:outer membrane protein transport protein [Deltaproteobacteria bacterium]